MPRIFVTEGLCFGDGSSCRHAEDQGMAIVHACKEPCHRRAVGYSERSLDRGHPFYLWKEDGPHLYLNIVDPPVALFKRESFDAFFRFVDRKIAAAPVLIHCNQGESRAPSLALLYMAKRLALLPDESYAAAAAAFARRFPYRPGNGIKGYLTQNWHLLGR